MEQLRATLLEIYNKNISYLQKNYINLYHQIKQFEQLNIENYFIDFKDNHFELLDSGNLAYYNCDPFANANYKANNLQQEQIIELLSYTPIKGTHYQNSINAYENVNEYITNNTLNCHIEKFIFIGTLLGVHINDIDKLHNFKAYLIVEPSIEVFRLSLFLTDYEEVGKKSKLFFSINSDKNSLNHTIKRFLDYNYQYNTKIQFDLAHPKYIDLVEDISVSIAQNSQMTYPYSEYIVSMKRGYNYFKTSKNGILNINNLSNLINKPVLYLGASSYVASKLEWIYLYQDYFIIVASSAILKRLEIINIIPDIIIAIDGQKDVMLEQFKVDQSIYKDSIIFASIKTDEELFAKIDNEKLFLIQDSFELFEDYGILTGVTVGDIGINLLIKLGVKELYLLGFDACINPNNGLTHDTLHRSSKKINLDTKSSNYSKKIIYVKGNFEETVPTFVFYTGMIDNISAINKQDTTIYNLSNGAYFQGTTPLKTTDVVFKEMINKTDFEAATIEVLKNNCKTTLNNKDIAYLKKEKKVLLRLKQFKIDKFNKSFDTLLQKYPNSSFLQIIQKYLYLIEPYASCSNNYKPKQQHLNKILDIFEQILKGLI